MTPDTIGNRLRSLRIEHEISQRELARDIGVSNSTIARIEKGDSLPDTRTLIAYSEHFCTSADWILFGKEHE